MIRSRMNCTRKLKNSPWKTARCFVSIALLYLVWQFCWTENAHGTDVGFKSTNGNSFLFSMTLPVGNLVQRTEPKKKYLQNIQRKTLTTSELQQIKGHYGSSPVVIEKYKLIFFFNEKSACTTWKNFLLQLSGNKVRLENVHNPRINKLKYLSYYNNKAVSSMILNSSWTKAAFVREPRARLLSCFLEKVLNNDFFWKVCGVHTKSFTKFLHIIQKCKESHWQSQVRAPKWLYKKMIIGTMSNITDFTIALLKRIGAWDNNKSLLNNFRRSPHAKNASEKLREYYNSTDIQDTIFDMYKQDYEVFGFEKQYF